MVGKQNFLITNIKQNSTLNAIATTRQESITTLNLTNACVLDPDARTTLTPEEAKQFDFFIFGGILGDDPPQKRTFPELTSKLPKATARNLGKAQMSTDTAAYVTHQIVRGKKLSDLKFQNTIEIQLDKNESTILPYQYVLVNDKPMISEELVNYIKKIKGF